jgi:hypothetical protein
MPGQPGSGWYAGTSSRHCRAIECRSPTKCTGRRYAESERQVKRRQAWFRVLSLWVCERRLDPRQFDGITVVKVESDGTHHTFTVEHPRFPLVDVPQECSPEIVFPQFGNPYLMRWLLADGTEICAPGVKPCGWRGIGK